MWIDGRYVFIVHPEIERQVREAADEIARQRRQLVAERRRREFRVIEDDKPA